jgi:hypothetical protein
MIGRIVALVVMTLAYWLCAFTFVGMLTIGDCLDVHACSEAKGRIMGTGLGVAAAIYLVLVALAAWALFKRRPD